MVVRPYGPTVGGPSSGYRFTEHRTRRRPQEEPLDRNRPAGRRAPEFVVIGGMKCGTTALHRYLDTHPDIATSEPKELNHFFGDRPADVGTWWRGWDWYLDQFPTDVPVRGEASPGYTSPDHPEVAERMAAAMPDVHLLYLTRDPLDRAVSQYLHHRRDGHERRTLEDAILDPGSQYAARGRHEERLAPFRDRFPPEQLTIVDHHDLLHDRRGTLRRVFSALGVDPEFWSPAFDRRWNASAQAHPAVPPDVREAFLALVGDATPAAGR